MFLVISWSDQIENESQYACVVWCELLSSFWLQLYWLTAGIVGGTEYTLDLHLVILVSFFYILKIKCQLSKAYITSKSH